MGEGREIRCRNYKTRENRKDKINTSHPIAQVYFTLLLDWYRADSPCCKKVVDSQVHR